MKEPKDEMRRRRGEERERKSFGKEDFCFHLLSRHKAIASV